MIGENISILQGPILEIGAGAGFLDEMIPDVIKSEIFYLDNMNVILDATRIPFANQKITAVVMTDVFHHIPKPSRFLAEVMRILPPGGRMVMIEPWVTKWASFIYPRFHHEPYRPNMKGWDFPSSGPLSGSNQALPWLIFERDRSRFEKGFPQFKIIKVQPMMPFRYLISGGVSLRSLMPGWSTPFWRWVENLFKPIMNKWGMFALIVIEKVNT